MPSRPVAGQNSPVPAAAEAATMSEYIDRADQITHIKRQLVDIFTGEAPRWDAEGNGRYLLLLHEEARLGEEAEKEAADQRAVRGDDRAPGEG